MGGPCELSQQGDSRDPGALVRFGNQPVWWRKILDKRCQNVRRPHKQGLVPSRSTGRTERWINKSVCVCQTSKHTSDVTLAAGKQVFLFLWPLFTCLSPLCLCLSQFEDYVMDICFQVLDNSKDALKNSRMDIVKRSDPVYVSRTLTAMVGVSLQWSGSKMKLHPEIHETLHT